MTTSIDYETIAEQIHHFYCALALHPTNGFDNVFPQPYAELPEFMKEDNRSAARRIGNVLKSVGLQVVPRNGLVWSLDDQDRILAIIKDNMEVLAEAEHDGWMEARLRQGWQPVKEKPKTIAAKRLNAENRLQHLLVPYADLSDQEKNKDRGSVLNYVTIIAQTEYRIEMAAKTN